MDDVMNSTAAQVPAFLGLGQQQSGLLVALYNELDPEFAKQVPTALPMAAQQLAEEYEKRNSVGVKLERADTRFMEEFKVMEAVQQEAVERLSKTNMDIDKAAEGLGQGEEASVRDLLLCSLLYGGVRRDPTGPEDRASMSPLASPNFEGAKQLLIKAFDKGYTMAAVHIGSLYIQEDKLAEGKNVPGQDPKVLALEWYTRASEKGNPMAHHKLGFFYDHGIGCQQNTERAIHFYQQAYEQGYPDAAHNLAIIYQGHDAKTLPYKNIVESMRLFEHAKQWGYAPSANALGRFYLLMSKDPKAAEEAGNPGSQPEEYIVTGIDFLEDYMELALVRGELEAYNYLVRILRAKMAAKVALEKDNQETFDQMSQQDKEKLIQQLAKEANNEQIRHKQCANQCDKIETYENEFKRCGQCQRVVYCSRECQKQHWKEGHKAVCSTQKTSTSRQS
ncbi:hypothetical protein BDF14DRAFT_1874970 [Spinellus fusiger]|nr:hypothetical protein BDF14DRAFT_1874970 [Spinellus fusiger]